MYCRQRVSETLRWPIITSLFMRNGWILTAVPLQCPPSVSSIKVRLPPSCLIGPTGSHTAQHRTTAIPLPGCTHRPVKTSIRRRERHGHRETRERDRETECVWERESWRREYLERAERGIMSTSNLAKRVGMKWCPLSPTPLSLSPCVYFPCLILFILRSPSLWPLKPFCWSFPCILFWKTQSIR